MSISVKQKQFLKAKAHHLKPVVITGAAGMTEAVLNEIDLALSHHELIKVKMNAGSKEERESMITEVVEQLGASEIQHIGRVGIFYRAAKEPKLVLP